MSPEIEAIVREIEPILGLKTRPGIRFHGTLRGLAGWSVPWGRDAKNAYGGKILLSAWVWCRLPQTQRRELVAHEICHLLTAGERKIHGCQWRRLMLCCGYTRPRTAFAVNEEILQDSQEVQSEHDEVGEAREVGSAI